MAIRRYQSTFRFWLSIGLLGVLMVAGGACDVLRDGLSSELEDDPDTVSLSDILLVVVADSSRRLPADGRARGTVLARIPRAASERNIVFTITKGAFLLTAAKTIDVRAEPATMEGRDVLEARATFVADTVPGTAFIRATISKYAAYDSVQYFDPSTSNLIP